MPLAWGNWYGQDNSGTGSKTARPPFPEVAKEPVGSTVDSDGYTLTLRIKIGLQAEETLGTPGYRQF